MTSIKDEGTQAYIDDVWSGKGAGVIPYAGRCVDIPEHAAALPSSSGVIVGTYEYKSNGTWTGQGTCIYTFKNGDQLYEKWEESSDLKGKYEYTGGTGKYKGASGGGTYTFDDVAESLQGGHYDGQLVTVP